MRILILAAGAALALAACKNNDQHDTTANVDENLTAENIVSNDVTAIDAVAADINYTEADNLMANEDTNAAAPTSRTKPSPTAPHRPPLEQPSPRESAPTTNGTE